MNIASSRLFIGLALAIAAPLAHAEIKLDEIGGMEIGFDRAADEARGFKVVENCKGPITIVPHKRFW